MPFDFLSISSFDFYLFQFELDMRTDRASPLAGLAGPNFVARVRTGQKRTERLSRMRHGLLGKAKISVKIIQQFTFYKRTSKKFRGSASKPPFYKLDY